MCPFWKAQTTFPTFSHNENQKAVVWLLWSMCALQRGGIRSISSVCVSLVNEMMSPQNGGVKGLQGPCPEIQPCKPGTVQGLCFSSNGHQGWGEEKPGKIPTFV